MSKWLHACWSLAPRYRTLGGGLSVLGMVESHALDKIVSFRV
jgi:hypothetical protein